MRNVIMQATIVVLLLNFVPIGVFADNLECSKTNRSLLQGAHCGGNNTPSLCSSGEQLYAESNGFQVVCQNQKTNINVGKPWSCLAGEWIPIKQPQGKPPLFVCNVG